MLAAFEIQELDTHPKRQYHPAIKCLGDNLLALLLLVLLQILPVGIFFGLFYLAHYLKYANPWHSTNNPRPGVVAAAIIAAFFIAGLVALEICYVYIAPIWFRAVFRRKMRRSAVVMSRTLYIILAVISFVGFIVLLTEGFTRNYFGLVESS
jgi:hypothetical protein